ncbi:MAG: Rrf2 family transcriptional regulator [Phycisphaerales bacterium]|nr:Rrf2 family transcriptional regulator [Phycisphaerales bacterium]
MLAVTRKTDYGLIVLVHLAEHRGEFCSAREIADRYKMPLAMVTNILKTLLRSGFIASERGSRGGYQLSLPAADISVLSVIESLEGPLRLVQCVLSATNSSFGACGLEAHCPIRSPIQRLHEGLREYLEKISVADIAARPAVTPLVRATVGA